MTVLVSAQTTRKYSNEFLNIGVDAAALGMSNAVVSHTSDVNSGYWNPAGLVKLEDNQLAALHSSYFANIANYNYINLGLEGRAKEAYELHFKMMDITSMIFSENNPAGIKAVLYALGLANSNVRLPLVEATDGLKKRIVNEIAKFQ